MQLSIVILMKSIILDIHHHKTYMYINFQQNWANRSVITVHTNVFAKKSQVAIRISENYAFRTCTTPLRTFMLILRSIGMLDIEIPRKEIISIDGQTDGQTSRTTTIGSFFRK